MIQWMKALQGHKEGVNLVKVESESWWVLWHQEWDEERILGTK